MGNLKVLLVVFPARPWFFYFEIELIIWKDRAQSNIKLSPIPNETYDAVTVVKHLKVPYGKKSYLLLQKRRRTFPRFQRANPSDRHLVDSKRSKDAENFPTITFRYGVAFCSLLLSTHSESVNAAK